MDFFKKYVIVSGVIENSGEKALSIGEIFYTCELIAQEKGIQFNEHDLLVIMSGLFDEFKINKQIATDGTVRFIKAENLKSLRG